MSIIAFPCETLITEKRCSLLPANVKAYCLMGAQVHIEQGFGARLNISDQEYSDAGATVVQSRQELLTNADLVLTVDKLPESQLRYLNGKVVVSFLDPFNDVSYVQCLKKHNVTSISMEMIPRSTRCQKMDALSSQASLAGYVMVAKAVSELNRILPMMMTAAGTIKPAKVFIIGAGVAGLQAIATAKRLGATVTAFDTRSVVAEQVRSLGAKFLEIDLGETGQTNQGYATALTAEQLARQQAEQEKCIIDSDIVITTAQLFGRKPPRLINKQTIERMKPGSVVVDMAAKSGGNVEGSIPGDYTLINGVTIIGTGNWTNDVAYNASQMYANNLFNLVNEFWSAEQHLFAVELEDDIQANAVITHAGNIVNTLIQNHYLELNMAQESIPPKPSITTSGENITAKAEPVGSMS
ncbi:NAD(P) transhydrogenase subunit alpha [Thalassotalea litorea]|uniref:NAD(P) transhydrogenase subunit alpha n=1 Tax=Thalassotalea litorea TaxID=2020715 RepID=UPI0037361B73